MNTALTEEFEADQPDGVVRSLANGGPIAPGVTLSSVFVLDPTDNRYYTYASMVIPSNDAFIGNGDPLAFELFDEDGNLLPINFAVPGSLVWDAGTEVNNETNAAFFDQTANNTGDDEGGSVQLHPGFLGSVGNPGDTPIILGGIQTAPPTGRVFGTANADFTTDGYELLQVSLVAAGSGTTLTNTTINANTATGETATEGGGGIFHTDGELTITGGSITNNEAIGASGSGGGILNLGGTVTVSGTDISGNIANRAGGGIEGNVGSTTTLTDVNLDGNTAGPDGSAAPGNGGGLHITGDGDATITGGTVDDNIAANEGGGLWNGTGTLDVDGTTISGNTASGAAADNGGGGIYNVGGTLLIANATISDNLADGAAGSGGGLLTIGGSVTVTDTTFDGNAANRAGGAIEITGGTLSLTDTDLTNNDVDGTAGTAAPGQRRCFARDRFRRSRYYWRCRPLATRRQTKAADCGIPTLAF